MERNLGYKTIQQRLLYRENGSITTQVTSFANSATEIQ